MIGGFFSPFYQVKWQFFNFKTTFRRTTCSESVPICSFGFRRQKLSFSSKMSHYYKRDHSVHHPKDFCSTQIFVRRIFTRKVRSLIRKVAECLFVLRGLEIVLKCQFHKYFAFWYNNQDSANETLKL